MDACFHGLQSKGSHMESFSAFNIDAHCCYENAYKDTAITKFLKTGYSLFLISSSLSIYFVRLHPGK